MADHTSVHPAVRAVANAVTALATSTWTSVAFAGADRFDTNGFHDPASNNTRLTVPAGKAGKYLIGGHGAIVGNATGARACRLLLNGATRIGGEVLGSNAGASLTTRLNAFTLYELAVGDYVEFQLWQDSGVSLNTENTANATCEFWMYRIGS